MSDRPRLTRPYDRVKRGIDVVVAGVALVVSSPAQAILFVVIRRRLGHPVLFRQTRPGLDERPFTLVKFRTMLDVDTERGLITDGQRLTTLGSKLRSTSLDELPTLWNVLRGDMSLVGPRPLLFRYLPFMTEVERQRHSVRPGITGLAQVSGRNFVPWDERLGFDVEYVAGRSLRLDVNIVGRTLKGLLRRHDVAVDPQSVMSDLDEERSR